MATDIAAPRLARNSAIGTDAGLLLLRIGLAAVVGAHGLQKLFGIFGGTGIDGFAKVLTGYGFTSGTTLLAWVTGLSETVGSALLLVGFATPIGASAVLGVAVNIVYVRAPSGFFLSGTNGGFEFQLVLGVIALALLFAGSGRFSADAKTPWGREPIRYGLAGLILSMLMSAAVILLFR